MPVTFNKVNIYTDGSCYKNPGKGGFGVLLEYEDHEKEISGGFKLTTNNRMEIMAAIIGLEALINTCKVILWSDSQYLVRAMNESWVKRWKNRNWTKSDRKNPANIDLWERLLKLCGYHDVEFRWIRGHKGNIGNNRCNAIARSAARGKNLQDDYGYSEFI